MSKDWQKTIDCQSLTEKRITHLNFDRINNRISKENYRKNNRLSKI